MKNTSDADTALNNIKRRLLGANLKSYFFLIRHAITIP